MQRIFTKLCSGPHGAMVTLREREMPSLPRKGMVGEVHRRESMNEVPIGPCTPRLENAALPEKYTACVAPMRDPAEHGCMVLPGSC